MITPPTASLAKGLLNKYVGEQLKLARLRRGLLVPEVAELLNVPEPQWRAYESGQARPTSLQLLNIITQLDAMPITLPDAPPSWLTLQ